MIPMILKNPAAERQRRVAPSVVPNGQTCPICGKEVKEDEAYTWATGKGQGGRKTLAHLGCLYPKKGDRRGQ